MLEEFLKYTLGEQLWPLAVVFVGILIFFGLLFLFSKMMNALSEDYD